MFIEKVRLQNFRNFKKVSIKFNEKTLVIGPNDVGKTNLIHALRILLDKSLSAGDIEPRDTDFNVESSSNEIRILIYISNITEDCILSAFKGSITDDGELVLGYFATRDSSGKKDYVIKAGKDLKSLKEQKGRHYLRALNLEYVQSSRNLLSYVKKEKRKIFEEFKEDRTELEKNTDAGLINEISLSLEEINTKVKNLSYIKKSLSHINSELNNLTPSNEDVNLGFDSGALNPEEYVDGVDLVSESNGEKVDVGGDGRNNQIFLSMWSSRKDKVDMDEVTIYCVEEPEAHLHPHNQRNLAFYLSQKLNGQVIITSHSPQIASEFSPNSMIKLLKRTKYTSVAASEGCSEIISQAFEDFSYRLNLLPAEAFFANSVLLVEGPSEVLFYKALSKALSIDIDRLGISILSVNGVDFKSYIDVFSSFEIPVVVRTDNDIVKNNKGEYWLSGLSRGIKIVEEYFDLTKENPFEDQSLLEKRYTEKEIPKEDTDELNKLADELEGYSVYLAEVDLEDDLANSPIQSALLEYYDCEQESLVYKMKSSKGVNMFSFLVENIDILKELEGELISRPLIKCKEQAEKK
ncbi:ATP-dependent nuclease [Halobacteriovorax sp. RT-2-4]|uniref:ATP-dependent nuclease n=1 Tax=unclassified Halobacteriovorax TaxID=2639665 RepID=UPI00399BF1D5